MSSPVSEPFRKPPRPQAVLTVLETRWLSPHLVRVVAGGPGFADLQECDATDKYAKLLFAKPELGLVPPYDLAALKDALPAEDRPVKRTYTIRWLDPAEQRSPSTSWSTATRASPVRGRRRPPRGTPSC
jgi:NADPH-dependent ferric siderophore reductase